MERIAQIPMKEYMELLDFRKQIESGKRLAKENYYGHTFSHTTRWFFTENELIEEQIKEINDLKKRIESTLIDNVTISQLQKECEDYKAEIERLETKKKRKFLGLFCV